MIKIYTASKVRHADMLRNLRTTIDTNGIHFNARWVETCNLAFNSTKPVSHWQRENFDDIERADAVFGYAEVGEHLKGGLVEIGFAIRAGKPIYLIGQSVKPDLSKGQETTTVYHPDYDPWCRFNPAQIKTAKTFQEGIIMVRQMFREPENLIPC